MGCELGALQLVNHLLTHSLQNRRSEKHPRSFHTKLLRSCQIKHLIRGSDRAAFCLSIASGDVKYKLFLVTLSPG